MVMFIFFDEFGTAFNNGLDDYWGGYIFKTSDGNYLWLNSLPYWL